MRGSSNVPAASEDFEFAALCEARNYRDALLWEFSEHLHGGVLEVGAGVGQVTGELLRNRAITRLVSIEPHPKFYDQLCKTFSGHTVIYGTIDDLKDDQIWDTVISINVLEHIENDRRELQNYHRRLAQKNGTLCLFVPARPEIYSPIDRDFGHFRRYTRSELRGKLESAGFQILRLHYYNFAGYLAWWLNFCLLRKHHFNADAVRFFDRFIFPPMHGFESRIHPPFIGQSLLATARAK